MASRYPIPWISTYFIAAIALIAGAVLIGWFLDGLSFDYDRHDPDFDYLERIARSATPREGDFSKLNGGDWAVVCLVGHQGDVAGALRASGVAGAPAAAIVSAFDDDPPVLHETEFVLAYVMGGGEVKLLRHPHGFAFARGGDAQCTTRDKAGVTLPVGR